MPFRACKLRPTPPASSYLHLTGFPTYISRFCYFNTLKPEQNGRHFAGDIFKCIFFNEDVWISIKISRKFVAKGPINEKLTLIQVMAQCSAGDEPFPGPMLTKVYDTIWRHKATMCLVTHWGRVTHICVSDLTIIGSDNGLSPGQRQAIIWTNAGILLIGPLGTNFSEILIEILIFSSKKMRLKVLSAKWRPFCLGLIVLTENMYDNGCWDLLDFDIKSRLTSVYQVP